MENQMHSSELSSQAVSLLRACSSAGHGRCMWDKIISLECGCKKPDRTRGRSLFYNIYLLSWLPLFEIVHGYDTVYKWFDYLKSKNHFVKGYVIMPNHLHVLIDFSASCKSINTIVSNGKRFMAYAIVKRLQEQKEYSILNKLQESVTSSDKERGKKHQVFKRSFDCKPITSAHFFLEKLDYIHNNPCSGVWKLVENPVDYKYSSAKYYMWAIQSDYPIID